MTSGQSPLFEPVLWEGSGFKILDEIELPDKIEYLMVRELPDALDAVRSMKTRAFGQVLTFLYSGALVAQGYPGNEAEPLRRLIAEMTQRFCDARPTFDFKGLGAHFSSWFGQLPAGAAAGNWIATRAREMAAKIVLARERRAERAARIFPSPARILTHCNVSGELVAMARHCKALGKELSVIATETRPYLQGTRLTAWELARAGVPVAVIPDCAVAQVLAGGEVDAVLVGSDRCARNGDIINKVGTYPIALVAKEYGVPFYVLVQDPGKLAQGNDVEIEERPAAELLSFQERPLMVEGCGNVAARYPAFDITPAALISSLIGFDDLFTPESFRKRYQGESAPARLIRRSQGKYLLVYGVPQQTGYTYLGHALKAERAASILVPEMRPELRGAHLVVRELLKRDLPATMISDNMMGTLFAQGEIHRLYLFYHRLSAQGPDGICGSALAALLAKAHGVPVELLEAQAESPVLADRDVSTFLGQRVLPAGASVYPVANETMPWSLFKENSGANS
jgi:methylthioribose-1-phosphate isomerase